MLQRNYLGPTVAYYGSYSLLLAHSFVSNFYVFPVVIQMMMCTWPIIYIGSHLSLKLKEVDPITGEKVTKVESLSRKDAMLFPVIGSAALLSLYIAYKCLPPYYVNMLLNLYLICIGTIAVAETLLPVVRPLCPHFLRNFHFTASCNLPKRIFGDEPFKVDISGDHASSYAMAIATAAVWIKTKHWCLHNVFAIAFSIQAIAVMSAGSFIIVTILLAGLFVYDIFWVFGTEVMVTVAKSFEGPAKLIFPARLDPWQQSILGLGDVVIPGILISMCLRFDHTHRIETKTKATSAPETSSSSPEPSSKSSSSAFDIHETFRKPYFHVNCVAYHLGLLTTCWVMRVFQHPQPALLYLVPFCVVALYGTALYRGELHLALAYKEEDESKADEATETKDAKEHAETGLENPVEEKKNS